MSEIKKLNSIIFSKSEEEFFDRLRDSDIEFGFNLADYVDKKVPLDEKVISAKFDEVGKTFINLYIQFQMMDFIIAYQRITLN